MLKSEKIEKGFIDMRAEWKQNSDFKRHMVEVKGVKIGGGEAVFIAGPCTVESEEQIFASAEHLSSLGVNILRGGCYKPRTSPYSFQGLENEGIELLSAAGKAYSLPVVSEVISLEHLEFSYDYIDMIQVGSRNMYHYPLLKELGKVKKPVLLKRAFSATYQEWLLAAEYIVSHGNPDVVLCERGIRTFEHATRNSLDISAVPYIHHNSDFPILVDPSHASGLRELIAPLSFSALAAGADGLMIETHPNPEEALCDGRQSLCLEDFSNLFHDLKKMAEFCRKIHVGERR